MIGWIDGPLRWRTLNNRRFRFCWKSTWIFQYVKLPQMVGLFQLQYVQDDSSSSGSSSWEQRLKPAKSASFSVETKKSIHPAKVTWNLKITQLKKDIIFQTSIFGFKMLIFQGVGHCSSSCSCTLGVAPSCWKNHRKWLRKVEKLLHRLAEKSLDFFSQQSD